MSGSPEALGWNEFFDDHAREFIAAFPAVAQGDLDMARVVGVERVAFQVWTVQGPGDAHLAGTLRQSAATPPAAGHR